MKKHKSFVMGRMANERRHRVTAVDVCLCCSHSS
jgi:hypothetical protein